MYSEVAIAPAVRMTPVDLYEHLAQTSRSLFDAIRTRSRHVDGADIGTCWLLDKRSRWTGSF